MCLYKIYISAYKLNVYIMHEFDVNLKIIKISLNTKLEDIPYLNSNKKDKNNYVE